MTTLGNNQVAVSQFLTETAICPGQNQEGNWEEARIIELLTTSYAPLTRNELMRMLDYEYYILVRRKGDPFPDEMSWWEDFRDLKKKIYDYNEILLREHRQNSRQTHAGHELGAREFTLTYSPKWMSDSDARIEMTKAIDKICKYYKDEILELRAIGEVGANGLSHVHCFYKLRGGKKITDKNFHRAWKYWNPKKKIGHGFEGGHHANVKEESDFRGYIDKDADTAWLEKNVNNIT